MNNFLTGSLILQIRSCNLAVCICLLSHFASFILTKCFFLSLPNRKSYSLAQLLPPISLMCLVVGSSSSFCLYTTSFSVFPFSHFPFWGAEISLLQSPTPSPEWNMHSVRFCALPLGCTYTSRIYSPQELSFHSENSIPLLVVCNTNFDDSRFLFSHPYKWCFSVHQLWWMSLPNMFLLELSIMLHFDQPEMWTAEKIEFSMTLLDKCMSCYWAVLKTQST